MSQQQEEVPWTPDPRWPWIDKEGRNSTHQFSVDRVRSTVLKADDLKYLRTYRTCFKTDTDVLVFSAGRYFSYVYSLLGCCGPW